MVSVSTLHSVDVYSTGNWSYCWECNGPKLSWRTLDYISGYNKSSLERVREPKVWGNSQIHAVSDSNVDRGMHNDMIASAKSIHESIAWSFSTDGWMSWNPFCLWSCHLMVGLPKCCIHLCPCCINTPWSLISLVSTSLLHGTKRWDQCYKTCCYCGKNETVTIACSPALIAGGRSESIGIWTWNSQIQEYQVPICKYRFLAVSCIRRWKISLWGTDRPHSMRTTPFQLLELVAPRTIAGL